MRAFLLASLTAVIMYAFVGVQQPDPPVKRSDGNQAIALALIDVATLSPEDRLFTRYVWDPDNDFETVQEIAFITNAVLDRTPVVVRPVPVISDVAETKSRVTLQRINLRHYANNAQDLKELVEAWEEFQFDPMFHLLVTSDTLKFLTAEGIDVPKQRRKVSKKVLVDVDPYKDPKDGKTYKQKFVDQDEVVEMDGLSADVKVIPIVSEHIDKTSFAELSLATNSQAPIVNVHYWNFRTTSTIQDKDAAGKDTVFSTIYGGLYYRFAGIRKGFKQGTDEDNLFEQLGIGNVAQKINAKAVFDKLRSDQRVALFHSAVTGHERAADILKGLTGRDSSGLVIITHDRKQANIDHASNAIANLIDFQDDARELIFEKTNGLHGFAMFNGKGELQDEVPFDVALDYTIPAPYGGRLQSRGCFVCHGPSSGWQPLKNDVKTILSDKLNNFGDLLDNVKRGSADVQRIVGLYGGDVEFKTLPRARDDYASAVLRATGPWGGPGVKDKHNLADIAKDASAKMAKLYGDYYYRTVSAKDALLDQGVDVDEKDAPAALAKLLPPVNLAIDGIIPEDPVIYALTKGISVGRTAYDLRLSFISTRIALARAGSPQQPPQKKDAPPVKKDDK